MSDMFAHLAMYSSIVVTGPQRSGTRIAAKMIAHDTGFLYVDESDYGVVDVDKWQDIVEAGGVVVHCPFMSHLVHQLPKDVGVVFMFRNVDDIIKSQIRIKWDGIQSTLLNYRLYPHEWLDASTIKYMYWSRVQHPVLRERGVGVTYESLSEHPLWIEDRDGFKWNQTEVEE